MKRILLLILALTLTACAPQVTVTSEVAVTLPSSTETPIPTPTEVPLESLPVEELVQKYLAGEIDDVSFLTSDHLNRFSLALAETLNATATEIAYKNGEAFLDPRTLTMVTGSENPEDLVFKPAYALTENPDGTYAYTDQWGETHQLVGLDKNDQHHIVTDATTDLIKFPQVDVFESGEFAGMPFSQAWLSESYTASIPAHKQNGCYINDVAFLRQVLGTAYFDYNRGQPEKRSVLEFGKIIRGADGTPLFLYKFLVTPLNNGLVAYQENSDKKTVVDSISRDYIFNNMPANHMVWLGTYGTELASSFYYVPQNAADWSRLDLHTPTALDFVQNGKLPQSKIPMIEGRIVIFEGSN